MSAVDEVVNYTRANDTVTYYSGAGDNDHDGIPDRADFNDGNGVDCSGWVWCVFKHLAACGYFGGVPPFGLGSTSTYSIMARQNGWVDHQNLFGLPPDTGTPGDILIHATNGSPEHSDGPVGHTGVLIANLGGGNWQTSESASSKNGVGLYTRPSKFWLLSITVPGMDTPTPAPPTPEEDDLTPDQAAQLARIESLLGDLSKPGALQDINARLSNVEKALFNPGAAGHSILQDIQADTQAIKNQ